ncbi:MAG: phosphotransferase family protein [Pseudorhodobacter sp.]|nr:phosphotransferase family protein [Frankiaceae bacterium]
MSADQPHGLDLVALTRYLDREVPGLHVGPLTGQLIAGGRSNLTYLVSDGTTTWVVRRPPLGHVLETAHDMGREHRVMAALRASDVPVPDMVTSCRDPEVLGAPFYVMSFVDGTVFRTHQQLAALPSSAKVKLADELVDVLARLHGVDVATVGLADLGRQDGYLERQVRRWGKQLEASRSRELPELAELGRGLAGPVPPTQRTALVHGDYKLDNVVVDVTDPGRVLAVLDWEMATLGDPLADLVNLVLWWDGVRDADGVPFAAVPAQVPGFPPSARLAERYAAATGVDVQALPWYLALACYKLAAIFEGMYYRDVQGLTVGEGFDRLAGLAPALAQRGLSYLAPGATQS